MDLDLTPELKIEDPLRLLRATTEDGDKLHWADYNNPPSVRSTIDNTLFYG